MHTRRLVLAFLAVFGLQQPALAQTYPTRPITLVVPFTAGAVTDIVARFLGQKLGEALGQPIVIENRAGAGGIVGAATVAKANPDGYTLLLASTSVVHGPLLQKNPSYDSRSSFTPVAAVLQTPFVLATNLDVPTKNISEFVAYVKANPGKINSATLGGFADAVTLMFRKATNLDVQLVTYRGVPEAMTGLVRNDAQIVIFPYASIQGQVEAKQIRMLAVTAEKRSAIIPDIPTFAEAGYPEVVLYNVVGMLAPANTPKPIVDRLSQEIAKIVKSEEGRKFITSRGNDEIDDISPQRYAVMLENVGDRYKRVIEDFGLEKR